MPALRKANLTFSYPDSDIFPVPLVPRVKIEKLHDFNLANDLLLVGTQFVAVDSRCVGSCTSSLGYSGDHLFGQLSSLRRRALSHLTIV